MKVLVNHDLCEGNMRCSQAAPEVFEVRDDEKSYVLIERPSDDLRPQVEMAVRLCPKRAVSITEQE